MTENAEGVGANHLGGPVLVDPACDPDLETGVSMFEENDSVPSGDGSRKQSATQQYGDPARWAGIAILSRDQTALRLSAVSRQFYVYVLCKPNGTPFYVGKGLDKRVFQHEAEAWNTSWTNHKLNVIRRIRGDGGTVGYVIDGLFEDEGAAHGRERKLIAWYGRHDLRQGPLTNQSDGGEGASNPSAEARARRAASLGGEAEDPERRVANRFLVDIAGPQKSVPIKPWSMHRRKARLLRPSPKKRPPQPKPRMTKAIVATAAANSILLVPGVLLPRRLVIEGVECVIETGCGGDMIAAGLVEPVEPRHHPLEEWVRLTPRGLAAVITLIGRDRLLDYGVLEP